eukprot:INCI397.1.p2 GENE.INCI397.1~~INCI397.1.p2  ORF type:complete len:104 (+),score=9.88 INCI397.1:125-436(+)
MVNAPSQRTRQPIDFTCHTAALSNCSPAKVRYSHRKPSRRSDYSPFKDAGFHWFSLCLVLFYLVVKPWFLSNAGHSFVLGALALSSLALEARLELSRLKLSLS